MKKITKVLMAAVAVSTLCFAGCKMADDVIGGDFIDYTTKFNKETGAEVTASIDYTNETDDTERGIRLLNDKKKDIAVNIIMDDVASKSGFMSVIFNKTENEDDTLNFIALGFNSKTTGNKAKMACTYYKNVSTADLTAKNFNRPKSDCIELMPNRDDDGFATTSITPVNGKLTVGFVITAKEGTTPYEVRVYKNKTTNELNEIADAIAKGSTYETPELKFDITNSDLGRIGDDSTKIIEAKIGFYANVYKGQTLKGEWQVADISHNPDGIIWEDEIPNTLNIQLAE